MKHTLISLLAVVALGSCQTEPLAQTLPNTPPSATQINEWMLTKIDGVAFGATASIDLGDPTRISGQAPCNRFFGQLSGTAPTFKAGPLVTTRMACDQLALEAEFLTALESMTSISQTARKVVLTNDAGRKMEFKLPQK